MRGWIVAGAMFVVGCDEVSEEDFQDTFVEETCSVLLDCLGETKGALVLFDDQADCELFYGTFLGAAAAGCDYDGAAASACLDALDTASCDEVGSDVGIDACDDVYAGESCAWGGTLTTTGSPTK